MLGLTQMDGKLLIVLQTNVLASEPGRCSERSSRTRTRREGLPRGCWAEHGIARIASFPQRAMEFDHHASERLSGSSHFCVPPGASVLEIGCGTGDLLAALRPSEGVGVDLSPRLIERARGKHSELEFIVADAESLDAPELHNRRFDFVVLSDVVGLCPTFGPPLETAFRKFRSVH